MKGKSSILIGGLVLACLGSLVLMQRKTSFGLDQSWPIFLIVIGLGILIQRFRDLGGWITMVVGIGLFLLQNGHLHQGELSAYFLPLFFVLLGAGIIWKNFR